MDYETFIHVNFLLFYCLSVIGQTINESETKYISILPDGSYGYFQAKKYNINNNDSTLSILLFVEALVSRKSFKNDL